MKKFTVSNVMKALKDNQSCEFTSTGVTYYLHVTENGDILPAFYDADETFTVSVPCEKYGLSLDQWQDEDSTFSETVYDQEVPENPVFKGVCEDLTSQANAWVEENDL